MSSVPFTLTELELRGRTISQPARWVKSAQLTISALVLPQVSAVLWWFQTHSWIHLRGFVNIEYLVLFAIALLYPGWPAIAALTAELTIALLEPLAHLYYFSPADAIRSFRYLAFVPPHLLFGYSLLLLAYMAGSAAFLKITFAGIPREGAKRLTLAMCVVVPCSAAYDVTAGHLRPLHRSVKHDADLRTTKVVRAPVASVVYATFLLRHGGSGPNAPMPIGSALQHAMSGIDAQIHPNIVLVLTESWGLAVDSRVNAAELAAYMTPQIAQEYRVETGTVKFYGSTTNGETRELCGDGLGRWGEPNDPGRHGSCVPEQMRSAGYDTLAVHGFTPTMYDRDTWYPKLGFAEQVFLPTLERDGARMCNGAFPGACDTDVARWIGNRLEHDQSGRPMFVHWVTLNSHLPVAEVPGLEADTNCHEVGIDDHGSLCAWFNHILDVHKSVADLAQRPGVRPTVFVIVGDHAPPFLRPEVRNRFSQSDVPWVVLMPRSMTVPKMFTASATHEPGTAPTSSAAKHLHQSHVRVPITRTAG